MIPPALPGTKAAGLHGAPDPHGATPPGTPGRACETGAATAIFRPRPHIRRLFPFPARDGGPRRAGYTLVELVTVCAVMLTLAAVALPAASFTNKRIKEAELRSHLRTLRNAIDEHKRFSDVGLIPIEIGTDGYPGELDVLIEPIQLIGQADGSVRFLRRVPVDPMTGEAEWGLRSYQDEPDDRNWGGENVYDVFSLSEGVGLNRVPYREW